MRVAVAGKGGSGKTTIAGTMARMLAASGRPVLAIDGDTNPNLAVTLGMEPGADVAALPSDLLERHREPDGSLRSELTAPPDQIIRDHALIGPDDLRLLVMGRIDHAGAG